MAKQWQFEQCSGQWVGDELWFRIPGKVTEATAKWMVEAAKEALPNGAKYLVVDVRGCDADAGYRQYIGKHAPWFDVLIFIGAGVVQRVGQKAIALSLLLTSKKPPTNVYVNSDDEARAWMSAHRRGANSA